LSDDRFGGLFNNPDYQIDEGDLDFKLRNPSGVAATKRKSRDDMDSDQDDDDEDDDDEHASSDEEEKEEEATGFQRVDNEEQEKSSDDDDEEDNDSDDSDEDGFRGGKVCISHYMVLSLAPDYLRMANATN
jgi:hypothetical protein